MKKVIEGRGGWWAVHGSPPPPSPIFLRGEGSKFPDGGIWKILKMGWSMVQGQVFLKGEEGELVLFLFNFPRFIIFTFRNYFTLCKIVLCIWRKNKFSAIIVWKNIILSCLKLNLKIYHISRYPICKGI